MTRRAPPAALILVILLSGLLTSTVGAASAPLPGSMAAVGDSISQAASTGGGLGDDYPANSWSTGTNSTVQSHYTRLVAAGAPIGNRAYNESVSGAKIGDLPGQMVDAVAHQPDYLTVLIGGNDLCTNTVGAMTDVGVFQAQFELAMDIAASASSKPYVYVVSIPEVHQLWSLFRGNWWARTVWSLGNICQSLLANPTSNQTVDVARRQAVRDRNAAYNGILAEVCERYERCHHDGGAVFGTPLSRSDVSADYFHPSLAGQAKLASVSWAAGYSWGTSPANTPPTAAFTFDCTELTCDFTDDSTDADGTIVSRSWNFGDGATSTSTNPSRTYAAGGTYTVSLTVVDDDRAPSTTSQEVTVTEPTEPPPNQNPTAAFTFSCTYLACSFTDGSTDPDGTIASHSWSFGDGNSSTSSNPSHAYSAGGTYTVTLAVTDNGGATSSISQTVTVEPPSSASARVAALSGQGTSVNRNFWRANVTVTVTDTEGTAISGATVTGSFTSGGTKSCTTESNGQCTLASDNLRTNLASVSWSVSGVTHASYAYDPAENLAGTVTVTRP